MQLLQFRSNSGEQKLGLCSRSLRVCWAGSGQRYEHNAGLLLRVFRLAHRLDLFLCAAIVRSAHPTNRRTRHGKQSSGISCVLPCFSSPGFRFSCLRHKTSLACGGRGLACGWQPLRTHPLIRYRGAAQTNGAPRARSAFRFAGVLSVSQGGSKFGEMIGWSRVANAKNKVALEIEAKSH